MKKILFSVFTLLFGAYVYATPITLLSNKHSTADIPINKVTNIINRYIDTEEYLKVQVQPIYKNNGQIDYLLAYLSSRTNYSFTTTKIKVDQNYDVQSVIQNYHLMKNDFLQQPNVNAPSCPDSSVEFVAATPVPYIPTAKEYVDKVYNEAIAKGYKSVELLGDNASVTNYENYLVCPNLKGFFNIGHGATTGIDLVDGVLPYTIFQSELKGKLNEKSVVLFNSCHVFNDPMKSALIDKATDTPSGADAQKYAGGITTLHIGTSEPASACFWDKAFQKQSMTNALKSCATQYDPRDQFGIGGNGGDVLGNA